MTGETFRLHTLDGTELVGRAISPADRERLQDHFSRLSPRSRYRRFLTPKTKLTDDELTHLTVLDHHAQEALVALDAKGDLVAVARYFALPDRPSVAEVAIAVADEWQHRGVGSAILAELMRRAVDSGITTFTASCLVSNRDMITLFRELGERVTITAQGASVFDLEITLPRAADAAST